jgi:hypothetical protein
MATHACEPLRGRFRSQKKVPKAHLTDIVVQRLKLPGTYFDAAMPAFGIRVGKHRKTWIVMRGRERLRTRIGHYPATSLADAQDQLGETLGIVATTAAELGIPIGENVKAMLDAHSVSFTGGTISLHDDEGIPLKGLGTGSTRLLIAGLQRKAAAETAIILVDETEYGLEPHPRAHTRPCGRI